MNFLKRLFSKKKKKKEIDVPNIEDEILLNKAKTLIGQWGVVAFSGEFNNVKITGIDEIIHYDNGSVDIRFITNDSFYNTILYDAKTVMNWVYNCDGKQFKNFK